MFLIKTLSLLKKFSIDGVSKKMKIGLGWDLFKDKMINL